MSYGNEVERLGGFGFAIAIQGGSGNRRELEGLGGGFGRGGGYGGGVGGVGGVHAGEEVVDLGFGGVGEGNFHIDSTGADKRVIELFGAVGCHD